MESMQENLRSRKELEETKRKSFLKKWRHSLQRNLIEQNHSEFGLSWLLRCFDICPNAYYNYRKYRKADYYARREKTLSKITDIYHEHHGVDGHCSMQVYLGREGAM